MLLRPATLALFARAIAAVFVGMMAPIRCCLPSRGKRDYHAQDYHKLGGSPGENCVTLTKQDSYLVASLSLAWSLLRGRARTRQPRHSASQRVKARPLRAACTCAPCSRSRHSAFFATVRSRRAAAAVAAHARCSRRTRSQALRARQVRSAARVAASEDAAASISARPLAVERRRRWAARAASSGRAASRTPKAWCWR